MLSNLNKYHIVLASKSPRRKQLLEGLDIPFEIKALDVEEVYPNGLPIEEIPAYLANLKAKPFIENLTDNDLIITADTIVSCNGHVLGKPENREGAFDMLKMLSGKAHQVITGVCILSKNKRTTFIATSDVYFKTLSDEEIEYYLAHYQPYDKAGSYGVQEWIGYVAVEHIEGSYFNVMGLPIHRLYEELRKF